MMNIAIFASGRGSNAEKIIRHFAKKQAVNVSLIISNKPNAGVLDIAHKANIETLVITKDEFNRKDGTVATLLRKEIDLIVLAGFLWLVPPILVDTFKGKIINIHPSLLPKFGGKGMYGEHVHQAVIEAREHESGITIHYVNEKFDEGEIIFQATCQVDPSDTPSSLAQKIHKLEHKHFPITIEKILS